MTRPTAIHALEIPDTYIAPGKPINIQPLISDAPADNAVTLGLRLRPPNI